MTVCAWLYHLKWQPPYNGLSTIKSMSTWYQPWDLNHLWGSSLSRHSYMSWLIWELKFGNKHVSKSKHLSSLISTKGQNKYVQNTKEQSMILLFTSINSLSELSSLKFRPILMHKKKRILKISSQRKFANFLTSRKLIIMFEVTGFSLKSLSSNFMLEKTQKSKVKVKENNWHC